MKTILSALALAALSAAALSTAALSTAAWADDSLSLTAGLNYSSGSYGNAESTQILYLPVTAAYETGSWVAKLTVPYIRVTGPGGVIPGVGRMTTPTATTVAGAPRMGRSAGGGSTSNGGLGDIIAALGRTIYGAPDETAHVDLVGKVKFGTADADKGLGTGKNDYSAQFDGTYWLTEETSLLGTLGYKVVGAPVGIAVNNVFFGSAGLERKTSDTSNVGVIVDYVQKITPLGYDQKDAMLYASSKLSPTSKLLGYVLKGFSDGSPDYGIGAAVTTYF